MASTLFSHLVLQQPLMLREHGRLLAARRRAKQNVFVSKERLKERTNEDEQPPLFDLVVLLSCLKELTIESSEIRNKVGI